MAVEPIYFRDIEAAETALRNVRESYLRRWGWSMTCDTPGSFWLWRRDFSKMDAERHARWETKSDARIAEGGEPFAKPIPWGVVMFDLAHAVEVTARVLDPQNEEQEVEG